ncbi:MAG: hypothetical protein WC444_06650 [Candidatus Paceibacterota bacterium]
MKLIQLKYLIKDARESATFERAHFYVFDRNGDKKNTELKERTKLYRDAWIISRLDRALEMIEKEQNKRKLK